MEKNSRINIRVSKEKHEKLKIVAKERNKTVTEILEDYIDRLLRTRPQKEASDGS